MQNEVSGKCVALWKNSNYLGLSSFQLRAYLVAQTVNNLPAMWETWVQSLDWDDPLENGMATHSSIHAQRKPMDRGSGQAAVHEVIKNRALLSTTHSTLVTGDTCFLRLLAI